MVRHQVHGNVIVMASRAAQRLCKTAIVAFIRLSQPAELQVILKLPAGDEISFLKNTRNVFAVAWSDVTIAQSPT
jgi:hypothetical protein